METTFISIHDLSLDARLLYVSSSIEDILGYTPQEVIGKSCWDYFHPDEIPFARAVHGRGIKMDKAAALNYCQIKNRDGRWVGCECVFTIVHDVLVGCTSVYRRGTKSDKRAREAPVIRRLFSSSPRDPRYHMLSYISHKFSKETRTLTHEPRAALFLNRFSRTLTIMYATNGLADIVGIPAQELNGRSFYYCIQENCLREAVKCLESAKANDSIAYLRFWFRDPRQDDQVDHDEHMSDGHSSGDDDDGGVNLSELMDHDGSENAVASDSSHSMRSSVERDQDRSRDGYSMDINSRSSSGNSTDLDGNSNDAIFDQPAGGQTRTSSVSTTDERMSPGASPFMPDASHIELEAVVSCTSDGLVVVLRRARPSIPHLSQSTSDAANHSYANGFFASPWATDPILPNMGDRPSQNLPNFLQPSPVAPKRPTAARGGTAATHGPATEDFMNSIREVAVFAWALTGINGSLAQYTKGTPTGESQPPDGLPVWEPPSNAGAEAERRDGYFDNGQNYKNVHGDWQGQKAENTQGYQHQSQSSGGFSHSSSGFSQGSGNPTQATDYNQALHANGYDDVMQNKANNTFVPSNCHIEPMHTNDYNDSMQIKGYDNLVHINGSQQTYARPRLQ
ncbi:hypothetical protein HO133_010039 [Letharia lupina]|uniref:PAS domain-containing protein n=1 Tax=Letharia lupina TaxID=560253 RepID=A0A8H6CK65_9LECA|nr:uncharacterized protein HO133_010039 [Letharia lupina]KAF6224845.1 hypothetical protein HO133_010039 [Letharia lupina]